MKSVARTVPRTIQLLKSVSALPGNENLKQLSVFLQVELKKKVIATLSTSLIVLLVRESLHDKGTIKTTNIGLFPFACVGENRHYATESNGYLGLRHN